MADQGTSTRLRIPALAPIYDRLAVFAQPLIRATLGIVFVPHGYDKLFAGKAATYAKNFANLGLEPGIFFAYFLGSLEFFGGIMLAIGLLTRPIAFMFFIEMAVATFLVHLPFGWFATARGIELVVLLSLTSLAFAITGGGRFSVDRAIGREF
jgi:putative oxidoreductase